MKCKYDKKILSFYLDNELSEEKTHKVELHLEKCGKCRKIISELKEISGLLNQIEEIEVSPGYDERFKEKFDKAVARKEISETEITPWDKKKLWDEVKEIISGTSTKAKVAVASALVVIMSFTLFVLRPGSYPTIITAKGEIQRYNGQKQNWENLDSGDVLRKSDVIKTAKNSFIDIELDGVYKMRVKEDSKVSVDDMFRSRKEGVTQFKLSKGNVLVKIDKKLEKSSFRIKTSSGIAEAKGTAFMVDARNVNKDTLLGVSEGTVLVKTLEEECFVNKDEKIVIASSGITRGPYPLEEKEEQDLKEIKEIGKIFIVLSISDTAKRTKELLEPSRLYAYGKYPVEMGNILDKALIYMMRALKVDSRKLHLSSIEEFEKIIKEYPAKRYNPQLLLFIGAYYEHLSLHTKAIDSFTEVIDRYSDTEFSSIAILAKAMIYEEKLGQTEKTKELYDKILKEYPETLEAEFVKNNIVRKISK